MIDRESSSTTGGQYERKSLFRLRLSHLSDRLSDLIQASSGGNKHLSQPKPVAFRPVGDQLEMKTRLAMMRDAVSAIAFLHRQGYMHCDIKSLNFLVCEVMM
jgi:serine/threonine protein kinase